MIPAEGQGDSHQGRCRYLGCCGQNGRHDHECELGAAVGRARKAESQSNTIQDQNGGEEIASENAEPGETW